MNLTLTHGDTLDVRALAGLASRALDVLRAHEHLDPNAHACCGPDRTVDCAELDAADDLVEQLEQVLDDLDRTATGYARHAVARRLYLLAARVPTLVAGTAPRYPYATVHLDERPYYGAQLS